MFSPSWSLSYHYTSILGCALYFALNACNITMKMAERICTFNVKGISGLNKRRQMFNWLKEQPYDIYLLQKLHCTKEDQSKWENAEERGKVVK